MESIETHLKAFKIVFYDKRKTLNSVRNHKKFLKLGKCTFHVTHCIFCRVCKKSYIYFRKINNETSFFQIIDFFNEIIRFS